METPFDRRLRRLRRDRAERQGFADYLHRAAAGEMLDRLDLVRRSFEHVLVLGCADTLPIGELRERGMEVTAADPGAGFAAKAGGVQCDEDRLPFPPASFDLILAIGTLDTVNDLPGALIQMRRALRPGGALLAAFAGAGSLPMLRRAMAAADEAEGGASAHLHPQIDVRAAGDLLLRAGFALPVADEQIVTVRFPHLIGLVRDLRAMAAGNVLAQRSRALGRAGLGAAVASFAADADADGKTPEHFHILHLIGWAPEASDQRVQ